MPDFVNRAGLLPHRTSESAEAPVPDWSAQASRVRSEAEAFRLARARQAWAAQARPRGLHHRGLDQQRTDHPELGHPPTLDLHRRVGRRSLSELNLGLFIDSLGGPVVRTRRHTQGQRLPVVSAQVAGPEQPPVYGVGRARDYGSAHAIAVLEALERFHGLRNHTGRRPVRGTPDEVRALNLGEVITPERLGLYPPRATRQPDFPCRPYHPHECLNWVQGWDVRRGAAVMLSGEFVFYGDLPAQPLVYESSNGCALGSSYEEAVYHGLLELLERDAALRWWAADLPLRQLEAAALDQGEGALLADALCAQGYSVRLFDATTTIPAVAVVAQAQGAGPALLFGFGAHADPQQAAARALTELSSAVGWGLHWTAAEQQRAAALALDPGAARGLADHPLIYADPRAAARLETRKLARAEAAPWPLACARPTLASLLDSLPSQVQILAADQTGAALRAAELVCVKVLARGLVPMSYGARLTRTVPGEPWGDVAPHPFS